MRKNIMHQILKNHTLCQSSCIMRDALILAFCLVLSSPAWATSRNQVQFYIEKYGQANPQSAQIVRAKAVFERVYQVADKKHHRPPRLTIVNSPDDIWAIALPDGHIVLSSKAVDLCYQQVSQLTGDTRLAFVMGHELAHLANDDFWHSEVAAFIGHNDHSLDGYTAQLRQETELAADDRGFIYAAMAGYPVGELLDSPPDDSDFFTWWQSQASVRLVSNYPEPVKRAELLRTRLHQLLEQLDFFQFGVRLSHFDRCEDSVYFLRAFRQTFPSREVFNNLGYCSLRLAMKEMGPIAFQYWLPTVLDTSSQLQGIVDRGHENTKLSPAALEHLRDAHESLQMAIDVDPYYLPAKLNLAVTWLYLDEIYKARSVIEDARQLAPDDLQVQELRAIILYEEGQNTDMWPTAISQLQKLAEQPEVPLSILYNTARLLDMRQRSGATPYWKTLASQSDVLPPPIRAEVCRKQDCATLPAPRPAAELWNLPVLPGVYVKRDHSARQLLKNWVKKKFDWHMELYGALYQNSDDTLSVLELAGFTEMVVLKNLSNETLQSLSQRCYEPLKQTRIASGTLWSCYDWSAWIMDDTVREVWVVSR